MSAIVRFGCREDPAAGAAAFGAAAAGALPCCCCRPPPSLLCCCCCGAGACCFGAPHALVVGTADGAVVVVVVACCPAGAGASSNRTCLPFPWLLLLCVADPERAPLSPPLSRRDDDDDGSPPPPLLSVPRSRLDDFSPSLGPPPEEKDLLFDAFPPVVVCLIIRCCFNKVVRVRSDDDTMNKGNHQRDDDKIVCTQNTVRALHSRERSARKKEGSLFYTRTNDGGLTPRVKRKTTRKKSRNRSPLAHSRAKKASTRTSLLFFVFTSTNLCTVI